jgi:hypothetical protein
VTQTKIKLNTRMADKRYIPEFAEAIGLTYENNVLTLSFVEDTRWGRNARRVCLDRALAEKLSQLLSYELDDAHWSELAA